MASATEPLKELEVGAYAEISGRPNPQRFVIQPVPALIAILLSVEKKKGTPLTQQEVEVLRDQMSVMVTAPEAAKAVIASAHAVPGVVHFDIARDLTVENGFIATEVYEDREAMQREEELSEVAGVVSLMQSGALARPPEWTVYEIASSESPAM